MQSTAFSPDGQTLATADGEVVRLWRVVDGALLRVLIVRGRLGEPACTVRPLPARFVARPALDEPRPAPPPRPYEP